MQKTTRPVCRVEPNLHHHYPHIDWLGRAPPRPVGPTNSRHRQLMGFHKLHVVHVACLGRAVPATCSFSLI